MKIIEAVYKRLGEILVIYSDGSKKKLENLTESELKRIDTFCATHHLHTDGNILEYTGGIVPLHCIIHCKKPFTYVCITTFGQTYTVTKLDDRFIKISRSTIININQVSEYNKITNEITFLNGDKTTDISRQYKKDIVEHVCGFR